MQRKSIKSDPSVESLPYGPGVYMMRHRRTGDMYIGSSCTVKHRVIGHLSRLRLKKHESAKLQALAASHGIDFECTSLAETTAEGRFEAEIEWVGRLNPTLNSAPPRLPAFQPTEQLNIKVDTAFKARLRHWCIDHHREMTEVLVALAERMLDGKIAVPPVPPKQPPAPDKRRRK